MIRTADIKNEDIIGSPVMFNDCKVGYITGIQNGEIKAIIDSDIVYPYMRDNKVSFSIEVARK